MTAARALQAALLAGLALAASAVPGIGLTEEEYYWMPRLFHLDDYDACLSRPSGVYCVGSFDLASDQPHELLAMMQNFSADSFNFNHTRLHRGYCVSARCAQISPQLSPAERFARCVDDWTRAKHGLRARLTQLDYCKTGSDPRGRAVDALDVAFAGVMAVLVVMNVVGTAYDVYRNKDEKPNKALMAWSLISNFKRLIASYEDGDPRLLALQPLQGAKVLTMLLVILAHTVFSHYSAYLVNPIYLEIAGRRLDATPFTSGSVIVQSFVLISSFLLGYNLLLHAETGTSISLALLPRTLLHRFIRITPVNLFSVGLAATWWPHFNDGPLWSSRVATECARCRDKFWAQALYVNNFYKPDDHCLIQTWFLAADMQLYVVSALLVLSLGSRPRLAMQLFAALFVASIVCNFALAYYFGWQAMLLMAKPEVVRVQFAGDASFNWLYSSPWGSLPAAALGLFFAFFFYETQKAGYKPSDDWRFVAAYRASVPLLFAMVYGGYALLGTRSRLLLALYAALDRPLFVLVLCVTLYGLFCKVEWLWWWQLMSLRVFQVLARLSLAVLMLHWSFNLAFISARLPLTQSNVFGVLGDYAGAIFASYLLAVPLHLALEVPVQKFAEALL